MNFKEDFVKNMFNIILAISIPSTIGVILETLNLY